MSVLGVGGVLELRREQPSPVIISPAAARVFSNSIELAEAGFITGDLVWAWGPRGLPFDFNGDGRPDLIGGFGMFFGSELGLYGPRAARLISGNSNWFGPEAPFETPNQDDIIYGIPLYIFRDELDRVSFYRTFGEAVEGAANGRLQLFPVDFGVMLIAPAGATGYQDRLEPAYPDITAYSFATGESEVQLEKVSTLAEPEPTGADSDRAWRFVAGLEEWTLNLTAQEIETSGLGQQFGDATRAIVTGAGDLNFIFSPEEEEGRMNAGYLARLLLILQQGCKAEASFTVFPSDDCLPGEPDPGMNYSSDLSYRTDLIFTSVAVSTRFDDVVRGSASFVTVGRVKLVFS